jgi:hypothetical protein
MTEVLKSALVALSEIGWPFAELRAKPRPLQKEFSTRCFCVIFFCRKEIADDKNGEFDQSTETKWRLI